jgi:hypothetical protein
MVFPRTTPVCATIAPDPHDHLALDAVFAGSPACLAPRDDGPACVRNVTRHDDEFAAGWKPTQGDGHPKLIMFNAVLRVSGGCKKRETGQKKRCISKHGAPLCGEDWLATLLHS